MQKKLQKGQDRRQEGQDRQEGQGLVEYALVLVLVAVVCIAIMFATGLSVQRVYGLVAGALGTRHNTEDFNGERIVIDQAVCYLVPPGYEGDGSPGMTNVTIHGLTNVPLDHLTLATDIASVNGLNNLQADSGGFVFRPIIDMYHDNQNECPTTVIVQSDHGAIATSPILPTVPPAGS